MIIEELIEKLKNYDLKTVVVVGGFDETGYADIRQIEIGDAIPRKSGVETFGEYDRPQKNNDENILQLLKIDHS